jgi:predicted nucleotidyltransferase
MAETMTETEDSRKIIEALRALKPRLKQEMGITRLRVFGSVAYGTARPDSDVDLIADFDELPGWEFFTMGDDIGNMLGRKVDLFTENSIDRYIRPRVLKEARDVF